MQTKKTKKFVAFALTLIIASPIIPKVNAKAITKPNTGLTENTKEERLNQFKDAIHPTDIKLNKIGAERVYGTNEKSLYTHDDIAEIGEEFIIDTKKSTKTSYELPSSLDNSELKYFPEIGDQGGLNSCAAWATTYYNMTYMTALKNDYAVKDNNGNNISSRVFSPKWPYIFVNDGENVGSNAQENFEVLKSHGAATINNLPYSPDGKNPDSYRQWPSDKNTWKEATKYSAKDYGLIDANPKNENTYVSSNIDSDLNQIKTMLTNGYLLNFYTYAYAEKELKIKDNPNTQNDNKHINEYAIAAVTNDGAHEVTLVGYNDDIWVDVNNNNKVDNGELGAFKVANSWGKESYNKGFYWITYDSLNQVSSVEGVATSETRRGSINAGIVEFLVPDTIKEPTALLEITLDHKLRNDIILEIGVHDNGRFKSVFYPILNKRGGAYSFSGKSEREDITVYVNLDYITKSMGLKITEGTEIGIIISDSRINNDPLNLKKLNLVKFNNGVIDSVDLPSPQVINANFAEVSMKYTNAVVPPPTEDTFDPAKVYNTGDIVIYNGVKYRAKYWTQGGTPDKN
ncbi:MAG: carbohydrate-binding protein, partial [Clostridium sp.]